MKKKLNPTPNEAIGPFIRKENAEMPEASVYVSITIPTHRSKPDSDVDPILLKNQIHAAEERLRRLPDQQKAAEVIAHIREAQQSIDFGRNLDSLVLYAGDSFSAVVKLPVESAAEVVIGREPDLRLLYKAGQQSKSYYILAISRNVIRLFEAFNDRIMGEMENEDFPFRNTDYYTTNHEKLAQDVFVDNLHKEYFNTGDKRFHKYYNEHPLPVILMGDVKSVAYYEEQMDKDFMVIARVSGNFNTMNHSEIANAVRPKVEAYRAEMQRQYLTQMEKAVSDGLLVTDVNDMYKAAAEGAAGTLYIGSAYSLDKLNDAGQFTLIDENANRLTPDEFLPALMRKVDNGGGDILFVEDDLIAGYGGLALARRY